MKKKKRIKFYIAAGNNARLNIENLRVVDFILSQQPLNNDLRIRIEKDANLRRIPMVIPDKEYTLMLVDIKNAIKLSNNTKEPDLYLYGESVLVATMVAKTIFDKRQAQAKKDKEAAKVKEK